MVDHLKAQDENVPQAAANRTPAWMGYILAVLGTAAALEVRLAIQPWLPTGTPFVTFYVASALAAWVGGRGPGVIAIGLGYVAGEYFFTSPHNTLKLTGLNASDFAAEFLYLCASVTITFLFARLREARRESEVLSRMDKLKQGLIEREVARRQGTEEALRQGDLRYRRVMETTREGAWGVDAQGKTNFVNERVSAILGYTSAEILERSPLDFLVPADIPHVLEQLRTYKIGTAIEGTCRVRHKNGSEICLQVNGASIPGSQEEFMGALVMFTDVTPQRRMEQALLEKEKLVGVSADAARLGTWIWESGEDVAVWNERMYEMFEVSKDGPERVSLGWNRVDSEDLLEFQRGVRASLETGRLEHEFRVQLPSGGKRWFRTIGHVISRIPGEKPALAGVTMDITERKLAEEALLEKESLLRAATNGARMGTWFWDMDRDAGSWNERMYEMLEVPRGTANYLEIGWSRVGPEDALEIRRRMGAAQETGRVEYEYRVNLPAGGTRWHRICGCVLPHTGSEPRRIAGVTLDITEEKRAEAAWREAVEQLGKTKDLLEEQVRERTAQLRNTISELEAFSYSLSHDMRAPLRTICSFTKHVLIEHGNQIGSSGTEFLERVVKASNRMDRLIQDVLSFSRLSRQEIKVSVVDVDRLVREIILEHTELQPPSVDITIVHPLLPMTGHEASLTQCLTNLLSNAVKFMAPGVAPRVRIWTDFIKPMASSRNAAGVVDRRGPGMLTGDISGTDGRSQIRLWIQDNGIGIKQEDQGRIFGLFHRLHSKEQYEGTGIGLAIVRKAVERMGGEVGVESEPGKGSRFWLQLPPGVPAMEALTNPQVHEGHAESWTLGSARAGARKAVASSSLDAAASGRQGQAGMARR